MGIRFHCHHCEAKLNIKSDLAGKRAICPECEGRFRIPMQSQKLSVPVNSAPAKAAVSQSTSRPAASSGPQLATAKSNRSVPGADSMYLVRPPSGGIYGPADLATIAQWVAQKRVTSDTYLAPVGSNDWQSAPSILPQSFSSR